MKSAARPWTAYAPALSSTSPVSTCQAISSSLISAKRTRVRFAETSDEEIDWHVRTGDVLDKAGAYAIQGRAALFIEAIDGDYWNVVGLPVRLVYELARALEE